LLYSFLGLVNTLLYKYSTIASNPTNLTTVYGICLPHNGLNDPNGNLLSGFDLIAVNAWPNATGNEPGFDVCTLTLTISIGHSAISAKNSADADAAAQIYLLYLTASCSFPTKFA